MVSSLDLSCPVVASLDRRMRYSFNGGIVQCELHPECMRGCLYSISLSKLCHRRQDHKPKTKTKKQLREEGRALGVAWVADC